jgi:UDP-3-O-[3-hydroxymyristoyl] N-acetylglucosamine deacetylase
LRYRDEFVKHKILDAIGDLYLLGANVIGKFTGYKSGHTLNNKLRQKLLAHASAWEYVTFEETNELPASYLQPAVETN